MSDQDACSLQNDIPDDQDADVEASIELETASESGVADDRWDDIPESVQTKLPRADLSRMLRDRSEVAPRMSKAESAVVRKKVVAACTARKVRIVPCAPVIPATPSVTLAPTPMRMRSTVGFPTLRRPMPVIISTDSNDQVDEWFENSGITIGGIADSPERQAKARRLFYSVRDCFVKYMKDVKPTDLIEHTIDLKPGAEPVCMKLKRYTQAERQLSQIIFPQMEEAGILYRASSEWGAFTQFPPKKKGSSEKRIVHNFKPVNKVTIKPAYPMHGMDEVLETIIRPQHDAFFASDASNGYWAVPMYEPDCYKAGVLTPHGQYIYRRMAQGLKGVTDDIRSIFRPRLWSTSKD